MRDLNNKEIEILILSGELFNKCADLEPVHANDMPDICRHITSIQNIIHARPSIEKEFNKHLGFTAKHPTK